MQNNRIKMKQGTFKPDIKKKLYNVKNVKRLK